MHLPPDVPEFLEPLRYLAPRFQQEACEEALARREESVPHLIAAIRWATDHPDEVNAPADRCYMLHNYALHLLTEMGETAAAPEVLRMARHPKVDELLGDDVAEFLPAMLAILCRSDLDAIHALILDPEADEFARASGVRALGIAFLSGFHDREALSRRVGELWQGLGAEYDGIHWDSLAVLCADFRLVEWKDQMQKAFDEGLFDPGYCSPEELLATIEKPFNAEPHESRSDYRRYSNVVDGMSWWECFKPGPGNDEADHETMRDATHATVRRAEPKVGRNDPCPCGSGRKYKKCCGTMGG